jgi:inosine-uridine nucleoside N-ribohydrolase
MAERKIVYIDSDVSLGTPFAEIDDAAAFLALISHPRIDIIGIGAVYGNVPVQDAYINLKRIVHFTAENRIPVYYGSEKPLSGDMRWFRDWQHGYGHTLTFSGGDSTRKDAVPFILESANKYQGQLTILSLGPMTNIALAIQSEPNLMKGVKEIVAMGGSFNNQTSPPEFNLLCDPLAAEEVIHSGIPATFLGLEITRKVIFKKADFENITGNHEIVALLKSQALGWIDRVVNMGWEKDGCALHDAVAAAFLLDRTIFETTLCNIKINTNDDHGRGTAIIHWDESARSKINIVVNMDIEKCREIIWNGIKRWGG